MAASQRSLSEADLTMPHPTGPAAPPAPAPTRGLRILCVDGGAIRGVFCLDSLRRVERALGKPVREAFDLLVGTSTGAYIVLSLQSGMAINDVEKEYWNIVHSFRRAHGVKATLKRLVHGNVLDGNLLLSMSRNQWRDTRLCDLPAEPRLLVCATQADIPLPQPFLIRNRPITAEAQARLGFDCTSEGSVADAIRCMTAAPTFYGPHKLGHRVIVDGAAHSNNPVLSALAEAAAVFPGRPIDMLISVGGGVRFSETQGQVPSRKASGNLGCVGWTGAILEQATATEHQHLLARGILGPDKYFRLNPDVGGECSIWESCERVLLNYRLRLVEWLDDHDEEIVAACRKVVAPKA